MVERLVGGGFNRFTGDGFIWPRGNRAHQPFLDSNSKTRGETGQGLTEYLIIVMIVAIAVLIALRLFGGTVSNQFQNATEQVDSLKEGDTSIKVEAGGGSSTQRIPSLSDGGGDETISSSSSKGEGSEKGGAGKGGHGGGDKGDLSSEVSSLKAEPVGGKEVKPIDEIELDWKTLGLVALVLIALGVALVLRSNQDKSKKDSKKKKAKKNIFTRGSSGGEG